MIQFDENQMRHAIQISQHLPNKIPIALSRALNRAAESARTDAVRETTKEYTIKKEEVRYTIKIDKATTNRLHATVKARDTRRPMIHFKVMNTPDMLRVEIKRGQVKDFPRAFLNVGMSSGRLHVLRRTGPERYPLHIKYGPSIPEMIGVPSVREHVEQKAKETLDKRLEHEINQIIMWR